MSISKAVITAAAPDQKSLPLQSLVDQQGVKKTALQLIVEEAVSAGAEEISIIICPGSSSDFEAAAGEHAGRLTFIEQDKPRGYGDALLRAKDFVGDEPFLHLISDHVYISKSDVGCAKQVVDLAEQQDCSVSAVQSTREHLLTYFGAVGGQREINRNDLYRITSVIEKPTPTRAEQDLIVAGLRGSHYLCLSRANVLTPNIMKLSSDDLQAAPAGTNINHSTALNALAGLEKCLA